MKKICTLVIGLLCIQFSIAQVNFDISDVSGNPGETVSIDVRVSDFVDISSMQFSINWDPAIMEYASIANISEVLPQFSISSFGTPDQPSIDEGELAITWNLTSTAGFTINEQDHLLFTLNAVIVGNAGANTDVVFSNTPRVIEFVDGDGGVLDVNSNDGSVTILGASSDLAFFVGSDNVMVGENFCVSITADNFTNVSQAQIPIQYDQAVLSYTGTQNDFFAGSISVPNNATGTFRYIASDPTLENPLTMPNGETLFEICFSAIGASGTSSSISIEDITDVSPDFPLEVIDGDGSNVPTSVDDGTVIIQGGSSDITFYFDDIEVELGQQACVPVKVRNFTNIQSFQYALDYNTSDLAFTAATNFNTALSIDASAFNEITAGNIRISWFDFSGMGINLVNDATAFEVCFTVSGDCDQTTELDFTANVPNGIEITDANNNVLPFVFDAGEVTIVCSCIVNLVGSESSPASCNGSNDGQVTVSADGGNGTYNYMWSNGDVGPVLTDGAGTYTVTVSDGENCNTTMSFVISEPDPISITGNVTDETIDCNGTISVTVQGGNSGYSYNWSDAGAPNSPDRTGLCKGDYSVTVTDAKGCMQIAAYNIEPKALQIVNFTINDVSCNGGSDGSIVLDIEGGCPPYTEVWSLGNGENLSAGSYSVTVTDISTPPVSVIGTYPVAEPDPIVISNVLITGSDENNENGGITLDVQGGTGNLTYLWTPTGQITKDLVNVGAGKYTLLVTDENNCVITSEEYCVSSSAIVVTFEDPNDPNGMFNGFGVACAGDCSGVLDGTVVAANGNVTYVIGADTYTSLPIEGLCGGQYTVTFSDEMGLTGSFDFDIDEPDAINAVAENVSECSNGGDGAASVVVTGGTGIYTYQWSGTTSTNAMVSDLDAGNINVVVSDENSCQFMIDFVLDDCEEPIESSCYKGRTVITPNDDGSNDEFIISCLDNPNNTLFVFDRFGRKVYEQTNYDNTWMGTNSAGSDLPENGYMWVLELITDDGARTVYKGTVTVVRNTF